jgi:hypothetical protein
MDFERKADQNHYRLPVIEERHQPKPTPQFYHIFIANPYMGMD